MWVDNNNYMQVIKFKRKIKRKQSIQHWRQFASLACRSLSTLSAGTLVWVTQRRTLLFESTPNIADIPHHIHENHLHLAKMTQFATPCAITSENYCFSNRWFLMIMITISWWACHHNLPVQKHLINYQKADPIGYIYPMIMGKLE